MARQLKDRVRRQIGAAMLVGVLVGAALGLLAAQAIGRNSGGPDVRTVVGGYVMGGGAVALSDAEEVAG